MTIERELRVEQAVSAGGVVYRRGEHGIEVVLCGRTHEGLWALPKGTPEYGESLPDTAIREVSEETGLSVKIVAGLGTIEYTFARPAQGVRFEKTVHHFLMEPTGEGSVDLHDREYDRVEWFAAGEALRLMTHRNEILVLRRALDELEKADTAADAEDSP
jgi:8-oxo-dGTP pyrophosphatase MutT (NUDIX family)